MGEKENEINSVNADKNIGTTPADLNTEQRPQREESIAFQAGAKAKRMGIPLRQSALRMLRPESKQYDDFIDGYDSAKRKRQGGKVELAEIAVAAALLLAIALVIWQVTRG